MTEKKININEKNESNTEDKDFAKKINEENDIKEHAPEDKIKDCINSSRIFVLLWISIIATSIYFSTFLPIFLFLIPPGDKEFTLIL